MIVVLLFVLGLCLGSFVNALVWRLKTRRDWVKARSMCTHCKHELAAQDLIPVISWVLLSGKCRYCHKSISAQYPLVESVTGILFVLSYSLWQRPLSPENTVNLGLWLALIVVLMALAVYDFKYMLLPNKLVKVAGLITAVYIGFNTLAFGFQSHVLYGAGLGLLAFGGVFWVLYQVSSGRWIGGGDVKLGFVLGAWLGSITLSFLAIFVASLIGSILAVVLMALKKADRKTRLSFGPLLIIGTIVAQLAGQRIINSYLGLFL